MWNSSTLHLLPQLLPSVALCLGDLKVMIRYSTAHPHTTAWHPRNLVTLVCSGKLLYQPLTASFARCQLQQVSTTTLLLRPPRSSRAPVVMHSIAGHVTKMFTDHVIGAADVKLRTEGTNALLQLLPLLRDVQSALVTSLLSHFSSDLPAICSPTAAPADVADVYSSPVLQALHAALCSQLKDCSETSRDLSMKCLEKLAGWLLQAASVSA